MDILFLLVVFATLIALAAALIFLLQRRAAQAGRTLARLAIGLAVYFTILVAVSLTSPQRVIPMNEDRCFDEWCIAVESAGGDKALDNGKADGFFFIVQLRISNHSRGRAQRAASAAVHLLDEKGNQYDLSPEGMKAFETRHGTIPPLTLKMEPGDSYVTYQVFSLPKNVGPIVLTVEHPVGFSPGWFVIGDESSLFHKPTIVILH